jgi:hypothetical protein
LHGHSRSTDSYLFSSQLQREREEMERRDLQRMLLDGEKKQKDAKKKQVNFKKGISNLAIDRYLLLRNFLSNKYNNNIII